MGIVLPTAEDAFGARPTPRSSRSAVSYTPGREAKAAMESGAALEKTGQQISRVATKLQDEADDFDLARAKANVLKAQIEVEGALRRDPDYSKIPEKYDIAMKDALAKSQEIIKSPRMREKFSLDTELDVLRGRENIKNLAFEKEASTGRGYLENTLKDNQDLIARATDEPTRAALIKNTQSLLGAAARQGYVSPEQAITGGRKFVEDSSVQRAELLDPETQLAMLSPQKLSFDDLEKDGIPKNDLEVLNRISQIENPGRNPAEKNPKSSATGMLQFMPDTAKQYGLQDPTDPRQSFMAGGKLLNDNRNYLANTLGRQPTGAELYLAHQQGSGGASALLANPDANAVDALTPVYKGDRERALQAVVLNGGTADMKASDFASKWTGRFDRTKATGYTMEYFPKKGDWTDYIPVDKRMAIVGQAQGKIKEFAEQSILSDLDNGIEPNAKSMARLDQAAQTRVKNYWEVQNKFRAATPEEEVARDVQFDTLARAYGSDPASILQPSVLDLKTSLNPDDFDKVQAWRAAAGGEINQANKEAAKLSASSEGNISQAVDFYAGKLGYDMESDDGKQKSAEFRRYFQSKIVEFEQQNKRTPTPDEIYSKIGDPMILDVAVKKSWFGKPNKIPAFEAQTLNMSDVEVPDMDREKIIQSFRARNVTPSDDQIKQVYLAKNGIKR